MIFSGLMIPFLGTTLGAGMVFFHEGKHESKSWRKCFWICCRCYDCSFGVVASYTFN